MNTLGNRIRQRRIELKLTQEELGKMVGYTSRTTVNKVELGISLPNQPKIELFAKALNTTPSYLMGWTDNYNNIEKDPPQLSDGEQKLIELFRQVPKEQQELVLSMINGAIESLNNN